MKRIAWIVAVGVPVAAALAVWWSASASVAPAPSGAAPAEVRPPAPFSAEPLPAPREAPETQPRTTGPVADLSPERRRLIAEHPALRERARQHALAPAADARWEQAVEREGWSARDLDPAVREMFRGLTLEPRYAEGGRIEGLVIEGMESGHPLATAGFRPGDRIDRIQGMPLRDPAEIPSLLARLGPRIDLCARRDGVELCREVALE